ncbi:hypothetical protein INR49_025332, partial [Caranx melampygus]
ANVTSVSVHVISAGKMNQEEVMSKLKIDVRSLLVSSKMGLNPDQLKRDYVTMLGYPMPLKPLGFRNVMDMVREMPDVVSVHTKADGTLYLKAVSDESTRHIEEMVAKQRVSKVAKKVKRYGVNCYQQSPTIVHRRSWAPPFLPAQLRAQLRLLLSQGPLRLSELEASFLRSFGCPLLVNNYGFYSIGEMLEAASDILIIRQERQGSVLSLKRTGPVKPPSYKTHSPASTGPSTRAQTATIPQAKVQPSTGTTLGSVLKESSAVNNKPNMAQKTQEAEKKLCQGDQLFQEHVLKLEERLQQQILENGVAGTISQELKDKLQKVVSQTSGGLSVHDLPAEYKRLFGEELPLQQSGFISVTELVGAMSDTFHLKPGSDNDTHHWIVRNIQDDSKESGMFGSGVKLPFMSYYFNCGESAWEGKLEEDNNDDITVDENEENKENVELDTTNISKNREMVVKEMYTAIQVHSRPAVPPDAVRSQRLSKPTRRRARELLQVLVETVETPGHFYIQVSHGEEAQDMDNMMFELR